MLTRQQFLVTFSNSWRSLVTWAVIGLGLGGIIAGAIPDYYESTARLMPPDQQAVTSSSTLNALTGQLPSVGGGSLLNTRSPGATSIGILESRTVLDEIIGRFDLRRVYNKKLLAGARLKLQARTRLEEDRKTGIITIAVVDRDKIRAQAIAGAYIDVLNRLLIAVSTSGARKERQFLESRLTDVRASLESSTRHLSEFSSRNAVLDPLRQGAATLDVAGRLEAQLADEESQLSGMETVYAKHSIQLKEQGARIEQMRAQLRHVTGQGQVADGTDLNGGEALPSARKLPMLGQTYYALSRQMEVMNAIYALLEKQYELARVQEAKEIPGVKVLDEPDLPERKCFPPRGLILAAATVFLTAIRGVCITLQSRQTI